MSYIETDGGAIFSFERGQSVKMAMDNRYKPTVLPSRAKLKEYLLRKDFFSPWGENNLWPIKVMDAYRACAPAQVCVEILTALAYGNGLGVYKRNSDGSATRIIKPDTEEWMRQSAMPRYLMQAFTDYFVMGNQFAQLIRNKGMDGWGKVANISAPFCRVSPIHDTKLYSESVFIHGSWQNLPSEKECDQVVLLHEDMVEEILAAETDEKKFMMRVGNYTPGNTYYHEAAWHALIRNGTIDIFPEIPKIRKNRVKNAMIVKYHVQINEAYWYLRHGGMDKGQKVWEQKTSEERKAERAAFYKTIDNSLAGSDNSFKSLYTPSYTDPKTGQVIDLVKITKIETEVGEKAAFDPDKMTSVADVFLAFAMPSSVANTVLSDNKSRGGGSDIREGNSSIVARLPIIRDAVFAPIDFCLRTTKVNGKPLLENDEFLAVTNDLLTTLDKSSKGVQTNEPQ